MEFNHGRSAILSRGAGPLGKVPCMYVTLVLWQLQVQERVQMRCFSSLANKVFRSGNIHPWPGLDVEIRLRKDCETWVTQIKTTTTTIDKKRIGIAIKDFLTDLRIFIGELNKRGSHMIISIPPQSPGGGGRETRTRTRG